MPVASSQCIVETEEFLCAGILLIYDDDAYSQCYGLIKETFRALTIDDIVQPVISDPVYRSSNKRVDGVGFSLYVFDKRYQDIFTVAQSNKVEFRFDGVIFRDIIGYVLVLTNKLEGIGIDGQKHFELK